MQRRLHRVGGHLDVAVGAVLETGRAGYAGGELAVDLALRRARSDGRPADEIADVLRGDGIQILGARAEPQGHDVAQQGARGVQAEVDVEGVIELRVVDEALPAHRGARLLEIHAHDHQQAACPGVRLFLQPRGVLAGCLGIVDRARPDDDQQPAVAPGDDVACLLAGIEHQARLIRGKRQLVDQFGGRAHFGHAGNAHVVGVVLHRAFQVPFEQRGT